MAGSGRIELLRSTAVTRGVLGSSRTWALVAVGIYGLRLLRGMAQRDTEMVAVEGLEAGEAILIRAVPGPEARRRAKAEKRSGRRRR